MQANFNSGLRTRAVPGGLVTMVDSSVCKDTYSLCAVALLGCQVDYIWN